MGAGVWNRCQRPERVLLSSERVLLQGVIITKENSSKKGSPFESGGLSASLILLSAALNRRITLQQGQHAETSAQVLWQVKHDKQSYRGIILA